MDFGNAVRGSSSTTGTAVTTLIATPDVNQSLYIGSVQLGNSSAASTTVLLNDTMTCQFVVNATTEISLTFTPPLKVPAGTALTFKAGTGVTTLYASAQGWIQ